MQLTLEIPDSVIASAAMSAADLTVELKKEIAVSFYRRGVLSAGKAAELAGASRMIFETLLAERRIERPSSEEDFEQEMLAGK